MTEIWKTLSLGDNHEISSLGRVRGPGGITLGSLGSRGYLQVCIKRATKNVHVLVAETFLGQRPKGYHVCHADGNKENNSLENLRYDTPSANWKDFRESDKETSHAIGRKKCPIGHELKGNNLMPSQTKRGWRACLSCSRAHAYIKNGKDGYLFEFEQLANTYYKRLTI
jgi:hypothetical protein